MSAIPAPTDRSMIPVAADQVLTYSPAATLVPTYECFNRCSYCNFRVDPGHDRWVTVAAAAEQMREWRSHGVIELLLLSGEVHPHSSRREAWVQHLVTLCELALELGLLPHTNAGPLSYIEMQRLGAVNVSMGLMLEQLTPTLMQTVHRHAPSKRPEVRLQQLAWAGELRIPFTTGLLLGIGETEADWVETLGAIAHLHRQWGHIQEVIVQPHSPGQQQAWAGDPVSPETLVRGVAIARDILPPDITLQIPPNLVEDAALQACLDAGARDLGGISPKDEVNPDYPHPHPGAIADHIKPLGWHLRPRLPLYPQYDDWLPASLQRHVQPWRQHLQNLTACR